MADEQTEVLQTSQGTPPAQGSEEATQETQIESHVQTQESEPNEKEEAQPEHSEETQEGKPEDQAGQQVDKPTRAERRVQSLLSKLKESQTQSEPKEKDTKQPYFTQEEIDGDGVDPNALEQRIDQRIQSAVKQAIEQDRMGQAYESSVKEHQADLEVITDIDPNIETLAVKQYEALNYQINPFTGKKDFVPAVKMSEIVKSINENVQKAAEIIAQGNRQYAQSVSENQAVPTSGNVNSQASVNEDTTNFAEFEKAYSSRA